MANNSIPVGAWVASIMTGSGANQSSNLTATINITAGWEAQIPVQVQNSAVSADAICEIYPSMDGGTTYDTTPMTAFAIQRVSGGGTGQASIRLSTGQYALKFITSGPNSQTVKVLTQFYITAINLNA